LDQEIEACNSNASARSSFSSNSGGLAARGSPPVCAAAGPRLATGLLRRWPALAPDPHCRSVPPPSAPTSNTAADCADRNGPPEARSRAPCGRARAARDSRRGRGHLHGRHGRAVAVSSTPAAVAGIHPHAGKSKAAPKVGGEERMKQMSVGKMMTGGPKGKVVFSSFFEL